MGLCVGGCERVWCCRSMLRCAARGQTHTKHAQHRADTTPPRTRLVLFYDAPAAPGVGVRGGGAKNDDRRAAQQRAVGEERVARDPWGCVGGGEGVWGGRQPGALRVRARSAGPPACTQRPRVARPRPRAHPQSAVHQNTSPWRTSRQYLLAAPANTIHPPTVCSTPWRVQQKGCCKEGGCRRGVAAAVACAHAPPPPPKACANRQPPPTLGLPVDPLVYSMKRGSSASSHSGEQNSGRQRTLARLRRAGVGGDGGS